MLMTFNPAINGWAIFSKASFTACRVMAKRLRDVCALPESEPLWRSGRGCVVRDLPWTVAKLRVIPPFEFENWAVIALGGIPNKVQVGDMGVDGRIVHPNCHWPPGWDIAGARARPGGRFRRRAKNRFPIPTGLNHSAQGCAGALPWVIVPPIFLLGTGCIISRQNG
jgi:hypothetical protein